MVIVDLTETEPDREIAQRRTVEDVRRRLLSLGASLDPLKSDNAALRRTAGELEAVVRRIRWLADTATHG